MRALLLALLFPLLQAPPRDATLPRGAAVPAGNASVSGRVYSAATGEPVRGVLVFLAASPDVFDVANSRMRADAAKNGVSTDAAGRFQIPSAVPGVYHLVAMPSSYSGRYLPAGHGATRGNDAGRPITIASNADLRGVDIALPSSLAIEGRVLDENGGPLSRMPVFAARLAPGSDVPERVSTVSPVTDDLGRYRIFGLDSGTYLVASEARGGVTIVDQVMGLGAGFMATSIQRDTEPFILTFHPSARSDSEAQGIRLTAQDVTGIDITLQRLRRLKLSGIVLDSQGSPASTNLLLVRNRGLATFSDRPFRTDDKGRFELHLDPGEYRLLIGSGLAPGLVSVSGRTEFAEIPLTLAADMSDVMVVTQPGIGLAGQVVFAQGPPASPPKLRIVFRRPETLQPSSREIVATMDDEFRFYGSDVFGTQLVRVTDLPAGWVVKAVTLAGTDITDVPTVFKQEDHGQLQVVLSSKASTLEGTVRGDGTSPAGDATIFVFGEDRSAWRMASPRTHKSDARPDGRFSVGGLAAGRYYAIAVARDGFRPAANPGEPFFDLLSKDATPFVIGDDERRTLELPLWRWPE